MNTTTKNKNPDAVIRENRDEDGFVRSVNITVARKRLEIAVAACETAWKHWTKCSLGEYALGLSIAEGREICGYGGMSCEINHQGEHGVYRKILENHSAWRNYGAPSGTMYEINITIGTAGDSVLM